MSNFSNHLTNARSRLLDAEALLLFLRNQENLTTLLNADSPEVTIGAMIDKAWDLVANASGDCEAMTESYSENSDAEPPIQAKVAGLPECMGHIDTIDEIHEQSSAMLNMLMLHHRQASQGEESMSDSVLEGYTWQLVNNLERADKATEALTASLRATLAPCAITEGA